MTSCKDCIHVDICEFYSKTINHGLRKYCESEIPFDKDKVHSEPCELFKDRSRFVELPYSLSEGDKLKYIFTDENNEIRIGDDWEVVTKICKDGFFVTGRINSDGTYQAGDCFYPWSAIGTEYFLTKEEAEQALKERES